MDNENNTAPKFTDLAQLTKDQCTKTDRLIVEAQIHTVLLDRLCTVEEANLSVNAEILQVKKSNFSEWLKASRMRFYIALITAVVIFSRDGDLIRWWDLVKGLV